MSTIYKIYKLKSNTVEKIYVFNEDNTINIDVIFEKYELDIINKYNIDWNKLQFV